MNKIMRGMVPLILFCVVLAASGKAEELMFPDGSPRMVNGVEIRGTVQEATSDGLIVRTSKGAITYPWKYLSAGTRYRYELPMLEEMKARAEAEAKEAARKAAAAKRAAERKAAAAEKAAEAKAAKEAAATNAPAPVATNAPAGN